MNGQEMPKYLGVKLVHALEMSEAQFTNQIKNEDYNQNKENRPGYLVVYEDGYKSWSPKDVFEKAYLHLNCDYGKNVELTVKTITGEWWFNSQNDVVEPTFVDRLILERKQLLERISKLTEFTDTIKFSTLGDNDQRLLLAQRDAMNTYLSILELRMLNICPDEIKTPDSEMVNVKVNDSLNMSKDSME